MYKFKPHEAALTSIEMIADIKRTKIICNNLGVNPGKAGLTKVWNYNKTLSREILADRLSF